MANWKKLYAKVKNNPKDVEFVELDRLLEIAGFIRRQPASGSSHYIYTKGTKRLTVPKAHPVKIAYVKQALEAMRGEMPDE